MQPYCQQILPRQGEGGGGRGGGVGGLVACRLFGGQPRGGGGGGGLPVARSWAYFQKLYPASAEAVHVA